MTSRAPSPTLQILPRRAVIAAALAASLWGCGALGPVVQTQAPPTAALTAPGPLKLEIVEGRPNGLLLRIYATPAAQLGLGPTSQIKLMRQRQDEPPITLQSLSVDDALKQRIFSPDGVQLVDQQLNPGKRYRYWLLLQEDATRDETRAVSEAKALRWERPLPAPKLAEPYVVAGPEPSVELRWSGAPGQGAVIFRRALAGNGRLERLALVGPAQDHVYIDTNVSAGGLYAYRVALARFDGERAEVPCFGHPGPEIFVQINASEEPEPSEPSEPSPATEQPATEQPTAEPPQP